MKKKTQKKTVISRREYDAKKALAFVWSSGTVLCAIGIALLLINVLYSDYRAEQEDARIRVERGLPPGSDLDEMISSNLGARAAMYLLLTPFCFAGCVLLVAGHKTRTALKTVEPFDSVNNLPVSETLVRASQEPFQPSKTLLRAAQAEETPADQLLRPGSRG